MPDTWGQEASKLGANLTDKERELLEQISKKVDKARVKQAAGIGPSATARGAARAPGDKERILQAMDRKLAEERAVRDMPGFERSGIPQQEQAALTRTQQAMRPWVQEAYGIEPTFSGRLMNIGGEGDVDLNNPEELAAFMEGLQAMPGRQVTQPAAPTVVRRQQQQPTPQQQALMRALQSGSVR